MLNKTHFVVLHRHDFRQRVASVVQKELAQITILSGSPSSVADSHCQKVSFMISGNTNILFAATQIIRGSADMCSMPARPVVQNCVVRTMGSHVCGGTLSASSLPPLLDSVIHCHCRALPLCQCGTGKHLCWHRTAQDRHYSHKSPSRREVITPVLSDGLLSEHCFALSVALHFYWFYRWNHNTVVWSELWKFLFLPVASAPSQQSRVSLLQRAVI